MTPDNGRAAVTSDELVGAFLSTVNNARTKRSYRNALNGMRACAGGKDWLSMDADDVAVATARALRTRKPGTVALWRSASRGLWKFARRLRLISAERAEELTEATASRRCDEIKARHPAMSEAEAAALGSYMKQSVGLHIPHAVRDLALFACMMYGLRREDIAVVGVTDYIQEAPAVGPCIRIKSDDGPVRFLSIDTAAAAVDLWLAVRGTSPGALFIPMGRHGRPDPWITAPMTGQSAYAAVQRWCKYAGLKSRPISMRHGGPQAARSLVEAALPRDEARGRITRLFG